MTFNNVLAFRFLCSVLTFDFFSRPQCDEVQGNDSKMRSMELLKLGADYKDPVKADATWRSWWLYSKDHVLSTPYVCVCCKRQRRRTATCHHHHLAATTRIRFWILAHLFFGAQHLTLVLFRPSFLNRVHVLPTKRSGGRIRW